MSLALNFGRFAAGRPAPRRVPAQRVRIALLGDFSGRAHRGELRTGDALAGCRPARLDVDTLERLIASFGTRLQLPLGAGQVELQPRSLDDLHPDALVDRLGVFAELSRLRQRLAQPASFAAAVAEVQQWASAAGVADAAPAPAEAMHFARGNTLAVDARLSDFARLIGRSETAPAPAPSSIDALVRQAIAPHLVQAPSPQAPAWIALVERAMGATLRELLQHPDFQCLESAWRSLDFIARRVETDEQLEIVVYDISAEEFAADLSAGDTLEDTGLYRLLVEQPALDAHQGPLSALIGHYGFEMTPPHAELLGRMARIAARAGAPFIAGIGRDVIDADPATLHPLVAQAWQALRALPAAAYLGLTVPRFLLRQPYGRRSDPIERFAFEEFDPEAGLRSMLWGSSALLAAVLLARHAQVEGLGEAPGAQLDLDDLPCYVHFLPDGEAVALPCTERLLTERRVDALLSLGLMPVLAHRGRPQVHLAGFQSVAGTPLAGPWTTTPLPPEPAAGVAAAPAALRASDEAELQALLSDLQRQADGVPGEAGPRKGMDFSILLSDLGHRG